MNSHPSACVTAFVAIAAASCSSPDGTTDPGASPGGSAACPMTAPAFTDGRIKSALDSLTLPDGVSLVDEQDFPNIDNHPLIDVVVRLCKVGLVGVPLKDAATLVGRRLKESPVGVEIYSLRVRNAAADADPHGRVRVDQFQDALLDPAGDPGAVRDVWKYADQMY
jgi:hypothetical protein